MAIVILGGLATSTLMNLFVLPALYLRFARPPKHPDEQPRGSSDQRGGEPPSPAEALAPAGSASS